MPSKTTKKARRAGQPKGNQPEVSIKDDGKLYKVVDASGRPVYPGTGVILGEAERLARGLKFVGAVVPVV
jgi:hypothetical protein